jgi:hypothetical protein
MLTAVMQSVIMLIINTVSVVTMIILMLKCPYANCRYAECRCCRMSWRHFLSCHFFFAFPSSFLNQGILKGKYLCTIDLLFDWFGISCMTTDNFCFYLQNRLIQTSQTGGQWYSDTSPFSIPCLNR